MTSKFILYSAIFFAQFSYASKPCIKDIGNINYVLNSCKTKPNLSTSTFASKDPGKSAFENLPVVVVISKDSSDISSLALKNGEMSSHAPSLPHPDQIEERQPLNDSAAGRLAIKGWHAKGEIIVFHAAEKNAGMTLVCGTAYREIRESYALVSQCTSFYEKDITAFHDILRAVEKEIRMHPN